MASRVWSNSQRILACSHSLHKIRLSHRIGHNQSFTLARKKQRGIGTYERMSLDPPDADPPAGELVLLPTFDDDCPLGCLVLPLKSNVGN